MRLTRAVTHVMLSRGWELDCTFGARLLRDALCAEGHEAEAIGTTLFVPVPVVAGERPRMVQIGRNGPQPEKGFDGHVVVRAVVEKDLFLLDPTIGQLLDNPNTKALGQRLCVFVAPLGKDWPTPARPALTFPVGDWSLTYAHDPELDWSAQDGWNSPILPELLEEVRTAVFADPAAFEALMRQRIAARAFRHVGRNSPCPVCGSGKKFKHCCGR